MDRQLWQAFAGKSVHIHTVGSEVYYFVQGHVEQATYIPSLSQSVFSNPATKCLVTGTDFHADSLSDEVCIKLNLHPIRPGRDDLEENCSGDGGTKVFSRRNIGKLPAEAVANAAELAAQFKPFELVYYPRAGRSEFVVQVEKVNESKNYQWYSGTRVKMAMETEYSKMTWYQGTVTSASVPEHGPWMGSPWRMLEVTWDEIDTLQSAKYVSPWEVELATPTPPIQPPLHPAKKFRGLPKSGMLNGEAELFSPLMNFVDSTMEQFNPSLLNLNSFPAGMQGARQKLFCESRLFNPCKEMTPLTCDESSMSELNAAKKMQMVSTDLLIGSVQFDTLSPDSQASVLSFATGTAENQNCCNSAKAGVNSIQLFGQVIYMNPPVENGLENGVSTNDGGKNPNQYLGQGRQEADYNMNIGSR
ncbi:Auxin response factor 17, partial [Cucurbita argyrosperma subsp. argyrosperma]